jgi:CAAX prenyl protease-like protein
MPNDTQALPSHTDTAPKPGWPYWLPMLVFLGFVQLGASFKQYFPHAYTARTFIVAGLLIWLRKRWDRIRWTHLGLGTLIGIVGTVQWVGMECILVWIFGQGGFNLGPVQLVSDISDYRNYPDLIAEPFWFWAFMAVRFLGPVLVVPLMEEVFWRDWLWRSLASPNNYRLVPVGEPDRMTIIVGALLFAAVHVQFLTGFVWALLISWLLIKTRSIGACIVAHAVTNFLLGAWVLATWQFPGEWVPFGIPHWFFW